MKRKRSLTKILGVWVAPIVGLTALAVAFFFYFYSPRERTHKLTITEGQKLTTGTQLGQALQVSVAPFGFQLEIKETAGSEVALDQVNAGKLDLALVQGGLHDEGRPNVRQVATLSVEPLHLMVKKELLESVSANLTALDGKTVNLGPVGSGTFSLAHDVLAFAGLHPRQPNSKGGYTIANLGRLELHALKDRDKMPDAVCIVSSLPSEMCKFLVTERDYRLVPLPFGEAFSLDRLSVTESGRVSSAHGGRVEKGRVRAVVIPAFTYQVEPPVPPTGLPALGTRLLLVAHKDVDARAIQRLVDAVYSTEFATIASPPLDTKLLEIPPEFPWHNGTRTYLERNTPVVSGMVADSAHRAFAIFAAAASGLFVLWQWVKQRNQFLQDKGFNKYISRVSFVEEAATRIEHDQIGGLAHLIELRDELARLKSEALARFTEGELAGHELMQGFLIQVNDVRDYVLKLIREQEENLDRKSVREIAP